MSPPNFSNSKPHIGNHIPIVSHYGWFYILISTQLSTIVCPLIPYPWYVHSITTLAGRLMLYHFYHFIIIQPWISYLYIYKWNSYHHKLKPCLNSCLTYYITINENIHHIALVIYIYPIFPCVYIYMFIYYIHHHWYIYLNHHWFMLRSPVVSPFTSRLLRGG